MRNSTALLAVAILLPACGQLGLGTGIPNDPIPSGTVVTQGNFVGHNGRTVTGVVSVYRGDCNVTCTFTVRLQSLSAPSEAGLSLVPAINAAASLAPSQYALRASSGNQNYVFSGGAFTTSFTQITIQPNSTPPSGGVIYGSATLQAVN